jgi:MEDS: MEthanogen/methylotroph, DcmR Sensory domain
VRDASGSHGEGRSHTHLCRVFDDPAEFRAVAIDFLADGLARGNRVRYVAEGDVATLRAHLAPLDRLPQAHRPDAVEVISVNDTYAGTDACVDTDTQVGAYAADTRAALADGFTGFRVAADATLLVRTPAQLDAFARYEHRVDRYMAGAPFSALCGYHRPALGDDVVTELACLHPAGSGERAPFRVHAVRDADVAVSGELDLTTVDLFATTMDRVGLHDAPPDVVVDATGLAFADHRNLLVLEQLARRHERSVVLRTGRRWPELLVAALELSRVRVERVVAAGDRRSSEH